MRAQQPRHRLDTIRLSERTGVAGHPERRPLKSYFAVHQRALAAKSKRAAVEVATATA